MFKMNSKKWITLIIILTVIVTLAGFLLLKEDDKNPPAKEQDPQHNPFDDIQFIKQQIRQQSEDISHLMSKVTTTEQSKENVMTIQDQYSKILLIILKCNKQIFKEQSVDVKQHYSILVELSDDKMRDIISSMQKIHEIYGISYFKQNFNQLVRSVSTVTVSQDASTISKLLHKYVYHYFAYTGKHSKNGAILKKARAYLENNNINKFATELSKIDSNQAFYIEYKEHLDDFLIVWNTIQDVEYHIENLLLMSKNVSDDIKA